MSLISTNTQYGTIAQVEEGLLHGVSDGHHPNGQLQVREHSEKNISHGLRTKWFESGLTDSFGVMMTVGQALNLRTDNLLGNDIDPEKNTFHLIHIPAFSENGGTITYDGEVIAYTRPDSEGDLYVPVIGLTKEALMGVQYELAWDHRMLSLKGVISNSLPGFVMGVHTYDQEGRASLAWDDATLAGIDIDENEPMMVWRFGRVAEGGTGLSLERALMVGQQEGLGRMPSAALYLRPDDRSRAALRGVIKAIDFHGHQIHLWVDTRGAQHWQLESASRLEPSKWSRLKILAGNERWQQLVLPHNEGMHFLRLVPMVGTDR